MRACACDGSQLPVFGKVGAKLLLFAENEELMKLIKLQETEVLCLFNSYSW